MTGVQTCALPISSFSAYTAYKTNYRTENVQVFGDAVSVGKFEVTLEFDAKNSWAKQDRLSDELLVHEQGHFDIGMLFVKELLAKFKNAKLTKANFNSVLQNIMTETSKKYNAMGIDYDNETDHSKNKEQQLKWNMFFEESLKAIYN